MPLEFPNISRLEGLKALGNFPLGLAALCAGWTPDYQAVVDVGAAVRHEGGGPKRA